MGENVDLMRPTAEDFVLVRPVPANIRPSPNVNTMLALRRRALCERLVFAGMCSVGCVNVCLLGCVNLLSDRGDPTFSQRRANVL